MLVSFSDNFLYCNVLRIESGGFLIISYSLVCFCAWVATGGILVSCREVHVGFFQ